MDPLKEDLKSSSYGLNRKPETVGDLPVRHHAVLVSWKSTGSLIAGGFANVVFRHRTWPARLEQYNGATGRPIPFFSPIDGGAPEHEVSGPQEQEGSRERMLVYSVILPAFLQDQRATEGALYEPV